MTMACASKTFADVFCMGSVCKIRQATPNRAINSGRREEASMFPSVRWVQAGKAQSCLSGLYRCRSCGWRLNCAPRYCRGSPGTLWRSPSPVICLGWTGPCRRSLPGEAGRQESLYKHTVIKELLTICLVQPPINVP